MSPEENKAIVRRFYAEVDKGNFGIIDELLSADYVDHSAPPYDGFPDGRDGVKRGFLMFQTATPGCHVIEDQIAEGDKVVTRLRAVGRHEGDLPGAPRTGRELDVSATVVHRVRDGQLVEHWSNKDSLGFLQQIGYELVLRDPAITAPSAESRRLTSSP